MSALREQIAWSAHRWILATFATCAGHPKDPYDAAPECEQLADAVMTDLGWLEDDP